MDCQKEVMIIGEYIYSRMTTTLVNGHRRKAALIEASNIPRTSWNRSSARLYHSHFILSAYRRRLK
jgi:hypothetical protein